MNKQTEEQLLSLLTNYLCMDDISLETDLLDVCIYDFLEFVEIIMLIEEEFKINFSSYDTNDIRYVKQVLELINENNK
ncbi:MAG: hypothetical protein IJ086_02735 [Clostridium sp.]|nr:hypothetical protein [Clostridium sp.]MBQ8997594.1 hypothetical protein [Clostridium sp.]